MNLNYWFIAVLIGCSALLASSFTSLTMYRAKYFRAVETNGNVNRALKIAQDEVLRLKKELGWSGKQLEMALKGQSPNPTLDWLNPSKFDESIDAEVQSIDQWHKENWPLDPRD